MAVVTGVGAALPGDVDPAALLAGGVPADAVPADPSLRLGRRGLRYKDRATQLGLAATAAALVDAGLHHQPGDGKGGVGQPDAAGLLVDGATVGVVASTNLGNVDTVCRVAATIAAETVTGTSPMDLPNASSNIVASSTAIRFGLRGVNLTLCNGETSGLDALWWAGILVDGGRVERVVVVGVEPDNDVVARLTGGAHRLDGAAAVVVEAEAAAAARDATVLATVGGYARRGDLGSALAAAGGLGSAALWLVGDDVDAVVDAGADAAAVPGAAPLGVPSSGAPALGAASFDAAGCARHDVAGDLGACAGALGVIQAAAGARWLAAGGSGPVVATAGGDDAWAALALHAVPAADRAASVAVGVVGGRA